MLTSVMHFFGSPGGDAVSQDALNVAAVEIRTNLFSFLRGKSRYLSLFTTVFVCGPRQILSDLDNEELEALDPLHYSPVDMDEGERPVVHVQLVGLTDVEGEPVLLAPHC